MKLPPNVGKIIGYTGNLKDYPTVYFTNGHYTQRHRISWDVGWDSCVGWECKFFGNVPESSEQSSHDPEHVIGLVGVVEYVTKLEFLGENRFMGGLAEDLSNWNLDVNLDNDTKTPMILREFWTKVGGGNLNPKHRFAHPSRHQFIPIPINNPIQKELQTQMSKTKGATKRVLAPGGGYMYG